MAMVLFRWLFNLSGVARPDVGCVLLCRSCSVRLDLSVGCTLPMTGILAKTEALPLSTLFTGELSLSDA